MSEIPVAERVRAGAALLDSRAPNWWKEHDLSVLDLDNCQACVLGQMAGFYDVDTSTGPDGRVDPYAEVFEIVVNQGCAAYPRSDSADNEAYRLGFMPRNFDEFGEIVFADFGDAQRLTATWHETIEARREEAGYET